MDLGSRFLANFRYQQFILDDYVIQISSLLYGVSYLYAKPAGSFMIKYLTSTHTDTSELLHKLVELSSIPTFRKMKPLFIEAFSHQETVLNNYEFLVDYLLTSSSNETPKFLTDLMELMYYSIYQTLKGESEIKRKHSVQSPPSPSDNERIAEVFLSNLKSLFEMFQSDLTSLNYLIKILCLIDFEYLAHSYHSHFIFMFKNVRQFFLNIDDDDLLESIANLFNNVCYDKNVSLKASNKGKLLENLFESMSGYLREYFENEEKDVPVDTHFKKIAVLYEKFNLNQYFEWMDLFLNWGKVLLYTGQITACAQYLIWSSEEITNFKTGSDERRMKIICFKKNFSDYTKAIVSVLKSIDDDKDDLKYKAYYTLCHLHTSCDRILRKGEEAEGVRFSITQALQAEICEFLVQFFKKNIVYDRSLLPATKRKYISCWLNLIFNGLIDIFYLIPLFECYYLRSQEYGPLIEWVSDKVYAINPPTFFNIVLATLGELAEKLFGTERRSLSCPEAIELVELAAKFSKMTQFLQFSDEVLNFINQGLVFTFKEEIFEFLVFLQNFIPKSVNDRQQCLVILQEILPPEYVSHIYVRAFKMKLKTENIKIGDKTLSSSVSTSITEDLEPKLKKRKLSTSKAPKKVNKTVRKKLEIDKKPKRVSNRKNQRRTYNDDDDEDSDNEF